MPRLFPLLAPWLLSALMASAAFAAPAPEARPAELSALLARGAGLTGEARERWKRQVAALSRQHDAHASGLYWHTDMSAAQAAARAEGKPILSLRLLGRLDEPLSCANSRLFRTVLYADRRVSARLRERFVLHWRSVRPAPRVTVDYGDGRTLVTTVTGNSLHYVLDAQGRPVDVLPGLYDADTFLARLGRAERAAAAASPLAPGPRAAYLARYHGRPGPAAASPPTASAPTARDAAPLAATKAVVEAPLLDVLLPPAPGARRPAPPPRTRTRAPRLDAGSLALLAEHLGPGAAPAAAKELEAMLAVDTRANETVVRPRVVALLLAHEADAPLEALTERIYAEAFLTPASDPWLGLGGGRYNGLARNGLSER